MNLLQPVADAVRVNSPLPWNVLNAQRKLLLTKGTILREERQIEALLASGMYVEDGEPSVGSLVSLDRSQGFNPFVAWEETYQRLGTLLTGPATDALFFQKFQALTERMADLIKQDADAAIFVMMQTDFLRYPISHSLQCGVLCALIAEHLDIEASEKSALVAAALTMNISMIDLQSVLSKQVTPLTDQQSAEIKTHPSRSVERLKSQGVTDHYWLDAVEEHHEQDDGSGYPKGLPAARKSARILRDVDIFWAMVSPREYRKALPPNKVARILYVAATSPGDSAVALIVRELGIYPPGSYVKLANGEIAIVTGRGAKAKTPSVSSFRDAKGAAFIEPLHRETSRAPYDIVEAVPDDNIMVSINPEKLFGYSGYQRQR